MKDFKFQKNQLGLISIIGFIGLIGFVGHIGYAQNAPQFMVSWQADSYAPSWYQGKIFPVHGSRIKIGFELTDNGKIIDLSKNKVRWYINDKLKINEDSGLGIKTFSFLVNDYSGEDTEIKIAVLPCDGRCDGYKGEIIYKIVKIPIVSSEAVIDAPYKEKTISVGENIFLAYPFFFNVKNLSELFFEWLVANQPAESGKNNQALDLNIDSLTPSGFEIDIKAIIRNLSDEMEFAAKI